MATAASARLRPTLADSGRQWQRHEMGQDSARPVTSAHPGRAPREMSFTSRATTSAAGVLRSSLLRLPDPPSPWRVRSPSGRKRGHEGVTPFGEPVFEEEVNTRTRGAVHVQDNKSRRVRALDSRRCDSNRVEP